MTGLEVYLVPFAVDFLETHGSFSRQPLRYLPGTQYPVWTNDFARDLTGSLRD
jgi:hypothetical protein